jgi:hypothetical protein
MRCWLVEIFSEEISALFKLLKLLGIIAGTMFC